MIDRGSRETASDTWSSRIRLVYLGKENGCTTWLETECGQTSNVNNAILVDSSATDLAINMVDVLKYSKDYLKKFPKYNTLINC